MKEIKNFQEFKEFLKKRYTDYEIIDYPETESLLRQVDEDRYGYPVVEQEVEHIHDNLGFVNKKTKIEEITLPNRGFDQFQGFNNISEIVSFLDEKILQSTTNKGAKNER